MLYFPASRQMPDDACPVCGKSLTNLIASVGELREEKRDQFCLFVDCQSCMNIVISATRKI